MDLEVLFFVVGPPASWAAFATFMGTQSAGGDVRRPIALLVASSVAIGLLAAFVARDEDVPDGEFLVGTGIAIGVVALAALAYFGMGRKFADLRRTLAAAFVISLVPLVFGYVMAWLLVASFVSCPPDAYECPV